MSGCDELSLFKALEVFLCVACLIYKWWTDYEASRLFFLLEKQSREWPLLNNVTWNQSGSWFADVTFGGYTIICIALFIAHLIGELKSTRKTECFLLGIGSLLFIGVGLMVLSSFDSVPDDLFDNALILGMLALITGFIFLIDIGCFGNRQKHGYANGNNGKRRDVVIINENADKKVITSLEEDREKPPFTPPRTHHKKEDAEQNKKTDGGGKAKDATDSSIKSKIVDELRSSFSKKKVTGKESELHESVDKIVENTMQTRENVTTGRRYMENRGFPKGTSIIEAKKTDFPIENYNSYDYEGGHSMRRYDRMSEEEADEMEQEHDVAGHRKRNDYDDGQQNYRRQTLVANKMSDSQVQTEDGTIDRSRRPGSVKRDAQTTTGVDYAILQSPKVTSSGLHGSSANPSSSEEAYEPRTSSTSYLLSEKGRKMAPTLSPTRIQKLSHCNGSPAVLPNSRCGCLKSGSEPTSPQDKGYVLHTASKWPNPLPLSPESYKKQISLKYNTNGPIHSDV